MFRVCPRSGGTNARERSWGMGWSLPSLFEVLLVLCCWRPSLLEEPSDADKKSGAKCRLAVADFVEGEHVVGGLLVLRAWHGLV